MKTRMTRSEYEYKKAELAGVYNEIEKYEQTKAILAQDGTDDENPAFGYNNQLLCAAYARRDLLRAEINSAIIVEPEAVGEGEFSEYAKSITLKCTFAEDDVEEEKYSVSRKGDNCISPASALFKFLHGKKTGFKGTFTHEISKSESIIYEVEILDIEF